MHLPVTQVVRALPRCRWQSALHSDCHWSLPVLEERIHAFQVTDSAAAYTAASRQLCPAPVRLLSQYLTFVFAVIKQSVLPLMSTTYFLPHSHDNAVQSSRDQASSRQRVCPRVACAGGVPIQLPHWLRHRL